jgi:hypothetical protein
MAQICEERKIDRKLGYHWPIPSHKELAITPKEISFPSISHDKYLERIHDIFEPIRVGVEEYDQRAHRRNFKKIIKIEKQLWDTTLRKTSLELCLKLRVSVGLPDEYEADETALAELDSFLADLADEEVDASEIVRTARKRL